MAGFESNAIQSFQAARAEMDELKRSMNEWVIFLDGSLRDIKQQLIELKRKVEELESNTSTMSER
ncbi:hypothetical protein HYU18_02615 [Candidatus Woesearchaeota archaeon]|nr:hypothetical protein [Candidatus Woesearchaeota archaeon]